MKNADLEQFPRTVGILFGQKMKGSRCRDPARPLWCRQQEFFGQIFRDIPRDAMNIDIPDVNDVTASESAPAFRNPVLWDESVYKNVKMGDSALLKFKNRDVLDRTAVLAAQVETELIEHTAKVRYRIAFDLLRIQGQREKTREMLLLGQLRDEIPVPLRFLWPAMFTTPTLAIQPMKLLQTSVAGPDDAPDAAMGISS
jgi:hypothetical protein